MNVIHVLLFLSWCRVVISIRGLFMTINLKIYFKFTVWLETNWEIIKNVNRIYIKQDKKSLILIMTKYCLLFQSIPRWLICQTWYSNCVKIKLTLNQNKTYKMIIITAIVMIKKLYLYFVGDKYEKFRKVETFLKIRQLI